MPNSDAASVCGPTWVDGIGPPLEQIEQDYREWAEQEPYNERVVKDVLALIAEVRRLRA